MAAAWWRPWLTLSRHQPTPPTLPPPAAHRTPLSLRFHTNVVLAPATPRSSATTPAAVRRGRWGAGLLARSVSGLESCPCAGNPVRGAGVCWRVVGGPARKAPRKQVLPRASALHQHPAHPAAPRLTWLLPRCPLPHAHMQATALAQPAAAPPPSAGVPTVCPSPAGRPRFVHPLGLHMCKVYMAPRQGRGVLKKAQRGQAAALGVGTLGRPSGPRRLLGSEWIALSLDFLFQSKFVVVLRTVLWS